MTTEPKCTCRSDGGEVRAGFHLALCPVRATERADYQVFLARSVDKGPPFTTIRDATFWEARARAITLAQEKGESIALWTHAYGLGGSIVVHGWDKA